MVVDSVGHKNSPDAMNGLSTHILLDA
jgi:hypothetical protein